MDSESTPTATELSSFPGTTNVVKTTSTISGVNSEIKIYSKHPANVLSLTGIQNSELLLNYNTNNAALGLFPMEYGFSNTDAIAGNYDNGEYSGTFTGNIVTTVDAWGTLTLNGSPDMTDFSGSVTRLKTVQNISLNDGIFPGVGTVNVTTYSYYNPTMPTVPKFRSTTTSVNVPFLDINQTLSQNEVFKNALLAIDDVKWNSNAWKIVPNPVENVLTIQTDGQTILSIVLTDVTGKIVLHDHSQTNNIEISHLQKGIYFAAIETDSGSTVKKFIKK